MSRMLFRKFPRFFSGITCLLAVAHLLVGAQVGHAQGPTCNAVIANLDFAISECSEINRNWVCYGSLQADAMPTKYRFFQTRDRREFRVLEQVETLDNNGVVLMNLQFEEIYEPVKVVVFGAARLEAGNPVQSAMTLSVSNSGQLVCTATPSGMVVHTDKGQKGLVNVNGVDIELASTAFITLQPNGTMEIANIEGTVAVIIDGVRRPLAQGEQTQVAFVNGAPQFVGDLVPSTYASSAVLQWLATIGLLRVRNSNTVAELACTGQLRFGETIVTQNIDPGQECLYNFCAQRGDVVTVDMKALDGSAINPWIDLRGPGGWLVSYNDDLSFSDNNSQVCNRILPLTSCDYTIVARSDHNETAGQFQLSLNRRTSCVQPQLRCEVVAGEGSTLYDGPGKQFNEIGELPQRTQLHPIERTADGVWALVQISGTLQTGWVNQLPDTVECEDDSGLASAASSDPGTPTPERVPPDEEGPTPSPVASPPATAATATPTATPTELPTNTPTATATPLKTGPFS